MVDFERARKVMVENQLRTYSITDRRVLAAMAEVPRERFVPEERRALAYFDGAHKLDVATGARRYLSAPAPFARLVQLASINSSDAVLDLACGPGYSTAVLARLAPTVVGIESEPDLVAMALANLEALGVGNAAIIEGSIASGARSKAPFDVIIMEGAVESVPDALFAQLRDGGRLVAIIRKNVTAVANLFVRSGDDVAARPDFDANLPALGEETPAAAFVF